MVGGAPLPPKGAAEFAEGKENAVDDISLNDDDLDIQSECVASSLLPRVVPALGAKVRGVPIGLQLSLSFRRSFPPPWR